MPQLKHVGQVINTGRKCVVVFRHIYDERGNITDQDNCLVVETERLPDAEHQDIINIVESDPAQSTGDIYNVLNRNRLANGEIALVWLAQKGYLQKYPTSNIMLTPDSNNTLRLDKLNTIVRMQQTGASEADINKVLTDDTDSSPRKMEIPAVEYAQETDEQVLDVVTTAKNLMDQAADFEARAKEMRAQAVKLDPSLKKTRRKKSAPTKDSAS